LFFVAVNTATKQLFNAKQTVRIVHSDKEERRCALKILFADYNWINLTDEEEMASLANIDQIDNEDQLEQLMNQTEDIKARQQIRRRQKEIREKRLAAFEAAKKNKSEDATTMRLRMAAQQRQRKMQEFADRGKEVKAGTGKEDIIMERQRLANEEKQRKMENFKEMAKTSSSICNAGVYDLLKKTDYKGQPDRKLRIA